MSLGYPRNLKHTEGSCWEGWRGSSWAFVCPHTQQNLSLRIYVQTSPVKTLRKFTNQAVFSPKKNPQKVGFMKSWFRISKTESSDDPVGDPPHNMSSIDPMRLTVAEVWVDNEVESSSSQEYVWSSVRLNTKRKHPWGEGVRWLYPSEERIMAHKWGINYWALVLLRFWRWRTQGSDVKKKVPKIDRISRVSCLISRLRGENFDLWIFEIRKLHLYCNDEAYMQRRKLSVWNTKRNGFFFNNSCTRATDLFRCLWDLCNHTPCVPSDPQDCYKNAA